MYVFIVSEISLSRDTALTHQRAEGVSERVNVECPTSFISLRDAGEFRVAQ